MSVLSTSGKMPFWICYVVLLLAGWLIGAQMIIRCTVSESPHIYDTALQTVTLPYPSIRFSWVRVGVRVSVYFKSIALLPLFAFSFSAQPSLKPLWGNRTTAGEAGVGEEVAAEGQDMETSDRRGTWGMASRRARLGRIQTRCPIRTHPTGGGTHPQTSEWGECLGEQEKLIRIIPFCYFTSDKFMNF